MTALHWCAEHGPSWIVSFVIAAGADVNAKNYVRNHLCQFR